MQKTWMSSICIILEALGFPQAEENYYWHFLQVLVLIWHGIYSEWVILWGYLRLLHKQMRENSSVEYDLIAAFLQTRSLRIFSAGWNLLTMHHSYLNAYDPFVAATVIRFGASLMTLHCANRGFRKKIWQQGETQNWSTEMTPEKLCIAFCDITDKPFSWFPTYCHTRNLMEAAAVSRWPVYIAGDRKSAATQVSRSFIKVPRDSRRWHSETCFTMKITNGRGFEKKQIR